MLKNINNEDFLSYAADCVISIYHNFECNANGVSLWQQQRGQSDGLSTITGKNENYQHKRDERLNKREIGHLERRKMGKSNIRGKYNTISEEENGKQVRNNNENKKKMGAGKRKWETSTKTRKTGK